MGSISGCGAVRQLSAVRASFHSSPRRYVRQISESPVGGERPAVILLHGDIGVSSGSAGRRWMTPFLGANGFRVYCPDCPGLVDTIRPEHLDATTSSTSRKPYGPKWWRWASERRSHSARPGRRPTCRHSRKRPRQTRTVSAVMPSRRATSAIACPSALSRTIRDLSMLRPGGRLIASVDHPFVAYTIHDPRPDYFATTSCTFDWTFNGQSVPMRFWRKPLHAMTDASPPLVSASPSSASRSPTRPPVNCSPTTSMTFRPKPASCSSSSRYRHRLPARTTRFCTPDHLPEPTSGRCRGAGRDRGKHCAGIPKVIAWK